MNSKSLFSYETLVHASSGAAGGVTAMSVFFPLDTIRSRLQVEDSRKAKSTLAAIKELIEEEGIFSLYRGLQPVLISLCCSNFVYFYTFHGLRRLVQSNQVGHSALGDLGVASIAGVINVFLTTPLWVANSRLKMQGAKISNEDRKRLGKHPEYEGLIDALIKISKMEGISSLWSSMVPSLMLVINPAIQFSVYEALKRELPKLLGKNTLNAVEFFLLGAIAKSVATVLTYPLQIVQQKLRYGSQELKKLATIQIFAHIIRTSGARGLYKGLEPKLLQTALTAALMFLCYEKIAAFVFHIMGIRRTSLRKSH
ncbi:peroxisomal membrane protein PMP34-like [Uloborus diversus]|uniref:peroxisomal membrane protein PMP34-like n=1 Tax=Uloborus diversus TaxID=327109 RepID=UPI00240962DC|nr:peroxisomal membrane protein PMP34-like [Uloborus diversus]